MQETHIIVLKHFFLLRQSDILIMYPPFHDFNNQAFGYNFVEVPMNLLDLLNCNIIVYSTKGTFLFADVIMTVHYVSIRVLLME